MDNISFSIPNNVIEIGETTLKKKEIPSNSNSNSNSNIRYFNSSLKCESPLINTSNKPTICFATMCKNEEHCIQETLESVYKYIDTWVVCDTGSTDRTCEIVTEFFKEKNIPGTLYVDEWKGFDVNKTLLFDRCYKKAEYIMHVDADDLLMEDFTFTRSDAGKISYLINVKRGSSVYKCLVLFNNYYKWRFCGVAHTTIKCLDNIHKLTEGDLSGRDYYVISRDTGARSFDPEKYLKDAHRLTEQFFNTLLFDPDELNCRSAFYAAQSYMDSGKWKEAANWYTLYTQLKNTWWNEEIFESHMRIASCMIKMEYPDDQIVTQMQKAIDIFPDRAEPHYTMGKYFNDKSRCDIGYTYFKNAKKADIVSVNKKYRLFVNPMVYGKYINDELSVACYWTDRAEEGIKILEEILSDPEYDNRKERLLKNREHFTNKYNI